LQVCNLMSDRQARQYNAFSACFFIRYYGI
jgi:hypothetical protein